MSGFRVKIRVRIWAKYRVRIQGPNQGQDLGQGFRIRDEIKF
jgi:hypothetical protein